MLIVCYSLLYYISKLGQVRPVIVRTIADGEVRGLNPTFVLREFLLAQEMSYPTPEAPRHPERTVLTKFVIPLRRMMAAHGIEIVSPGRPERLLPNVAQ